MARAVPASPPSLFTALGYGHANHGRVAGNTPITLALQGISADLRPPVNHPHPVTRVRCRSVHRDGGARNSIVQEIISMDTTDLRGSESTASPAMPVRGCSSAFASRPI